MSEYRDYEWTEERGKSAHSYLYNDLLALLNPDLNHLILDVGCGNGLLANRLIQAGYNVYGTDASVSGIKIAKKQNSDRFYVQDLSSPELPKELVTTQRK